MLRLRHTRIEIDGTIRICIAVGRGIVVRRSIVARGDSRGSCGIRIITRSSTIIVILNRIHCIVLVVEAVVEHLK